MHTHLKLDQLFANQCAQSSVKDVTAVTASSETESKPVTTIPQALDLHHEATRCMKPPPSATLPTHPYPHHRASPTRSSCLVRQYLHPTTALERLSSGGKQACSAPSRLDGSRGELRPLGVRKVSCGTCPTRQTRWPYRLHHDCAHLGSRHARQHESECKQEGREGRMENQGRTRHARTDGCRAQKHQHDI